MKTALMRAEHKAAVLDNVVSEASKLRSELYDERAKNLALRDSLAVAMESLERCSHDKSVLKEILKATRAVHEDETAEKLSIISELSETRARQLDSIKLYKSKLSEKSDYDEQIDSMNADYAEQIDSMKSDYAVQIGSMRADYAELEGVAQSLVDDNAELKRLRREDDKKRVFVITKQQRRGRAAGTVSREPLERLRSEGKKLRSEANSRALRDHDTLPVVVLLLALLPVVVLSLLLWGF
tara:strand:- start:2854 stop:3573 length:720 start_codon:yes stop_codon:yes gene_type:complete